MDFLSSSGGCATALPRASALALVSALIFGCSSSGDASSVGAGTGGNADASTSNGGIQSGGGASAGGRTNGGMSGNGGSNGGAAGSSAGTTGAPFGCDNPTVIHVSNGPVSSPEDTGYDMCGSSFVARRRVVKDCPLGPTTTTTCPNTICSSDADCTRESHGYCAESRHLAGYCGCYYGCMKDSDCDAGSVCFCGTPVGRCVPATCTDDSDCGAGQLCATYLAVCVPGTGGTGVACTGAVDGCFSGFACQNATDECLGNDDCPSAKPRCELQGDHRVCAPECPGPPTPTP